MNIIKSLKDTCKLILYLQLIRIVQPFMLYQDSGVK
jgi:hypothetical protein